MPTNCGDFSVYADGSIAVLTPLSDEARGWCEEHLPDDGTVWGGGYVIEPRYLGPILEGIEDDGLSVN